MLLFFVKFLPNVFGISQNVSDFDKSDAKIAIFQINVKKKNCYQYLNVAANFVKSV